MSAHENPPAFPFGQNWTMPDGEPNWKNHDGMTLRDWFAGQALVGLLSDNATISRFHIIAGERPEWSLRSVAAGIAYEYSDAMLAARSKAGEA